MIIEIPNDDNLDIKNIVFDFNGTIAISGKIIDGVFDKIIKLSENFNISIVTADTFGSVKKIFKDTNINIHIISKDNGSLDKMNYIKKIGALNTIALGNGNNDSMMLSKAKIGISILNQEGLSLEALKSSNILLKDINDFFKMIEEPKKFIAILRK